MIKEHDCVVLTTDVPNEGLEVEFMTLTGEAVGIVTLLAGQVRPLNRRDLAHTREMAPA